MTTPKPSDDILPSWLQIQAKLGKLRQDIDIHGQDIDVFNRQLVAIEAGLRKIDERLKRLEKTTAPTDPYEAEIAAAVAAKDPQRLQEAAVFASASPQAKPSARAMEAARLLVHYCFAHSGSVDAIARIIDNVYSGKDPTGKP